MSWSLSSAKAMGRIGTISSLDCLAATGQMSGSIQDLQYGILSRIYMAAATKPAVYFVGDEDQSIYESLGATTKTPEQIASEFGLDEIEHFTLHGNYRSTQQLSICIGS